MNNLRKSGIDTELSKLVINGEGTVRIQESDDCFYLTSKNTVIINNSFESKLIKARVKVTMSNIKDMVKNKYNVEIKESILV